jgi:hypothetical protein
MKQQPMPETPQSKEPTAIDDSKLPDSKIWPRPDISKGFQQYF